MAGAVAELEADLDPFGGRGWRHVGRWSLRLRLCDGGSDGAGVGCGMLQCGRRGGYRYRGAVAGDGRGRGRGRGVGVGVRGALVGPGTDGQGGCGYAARRGAGEDDEAGLVPLQLPVGGDGDLCGDEGVPQGRVEDGRGGGVSRRWLSPQVGIGRGGKAEQAHVLR